MLSQTALTCLLLLLTLVPDVQSRRGMGGRWGGGGIGRPGGGWGANRGGYHNFNHNHKAPHGHPGSSSSGSNVGKMAGAAAAGALGGMVLGHGLSSVARSGHGYGYGGHGEYGHGYPGVHGYPRHGGELRNGHELHGERADVMFRNETDMEYYVGSASRGRMSGMVLFGAAVSFCLW